MSYFEKVQKNIVSARFSKILADFDKKCTKLVILSIHIFVSRADKNQFYAICHSTHSEMSKYSRVASISQRIAENEPIIKSIKLTIFYHHFSATIHVKHAILM